MYKRQVEDGIFVLGDDCDTTLGKDICDAIGLNDTAIEFEITSNRADCLSVTGLARETAATFKKPLTIKKPVVKEGHGNVNDFLKVNIDCPATCYRCLLYTSSYEYHKQNCTYTDCYRRYKLGFDRTFQI